jgi:hypothetical protein
MACCCVNLEYDLWLSGSRPLFAVASCPPLWMAVCLYYLPNRHFCGWLLMAHGRGNPDWGSGRAELRLCRSTEFEDEVRRLGLDEHNCADSDQLRRWCEHNKHRVYVPERLLKYWRIDVDPNVC